MVSDGDGAAPRGSQQPPLRPMTEQAMREILTAVEDVEDPDRVIAIAVLTGSPELGLAVAVLGGQGGLDLNQQGLTSLFLHAFIDYNITPEQPSNPEQPE